MSNIIILTNYTVYPYHKNIATMITSALSSLSHSVQSVDITSTQYPHQCLAELTSMNPDILITLDLAGFHFRTQSGENALNMLYTKNLNLVWGNRPEYADFLNKKVSLSMLFYDATGRDYQLSTYYPNVLYYKAHSDYSITQDDNSPANSIHFLSIWEDFLSEIFL